MLAELLIPLFIISLGGAVGSMALDLAVDCFAHDDDKKLLLTNITDSLFYWSYICMVLTVIANIVVMIIY